MPIQLIKIFRLCFVRFGELPPDGKSLNHLTGQHEAGVSVYEAICISGKYSILLPSPTPSACVSLSGHFDKPAYEVRGKVVGVGSDGEPVLADCEIVCLAPLRGAERLDEDVPRVKRHE